jgi:hypothetical protein
VFRASLLTVLIILATNQRSATPDVVIKNRIDGCVTIERKKTTTLANLVVMDIAVTVKKSSGECGCMSASATYTSYLVRGRTKEVLQQGQIRILQGGDQKLVLASDAALIEGQPVIVELGCTPPS